MSNKTKLIAAIIVNGAIIIFELIGLIMSIFTIGVGMFQYYTQDSNYFALIVSIIFEIYAIKSFASGTTIPLFVSRLRYFATCCLTVTFLVVLFILIPMFGLDSFANMLFGGTMLYHHTLCPILAIISLIMFEPQNKLDLKAIAESMIFTIIYAIITITLNIAKLLVGPYPFLMVYNQPVIMSIVWCLTILGIALLISFVLAYFTNKQNKR